MPGHIPWSKADMWLRSPRSIWLSTTRPDGRPHAAPVWFIWDGTSLYFTTPRRSQKGRNLMHQPAIVVHAGDGDDVVILEGVAHVVTDQDELARVDAAYLAKYVDPRSGARASIFDGAGDDLYRVEVARIMAWEYGVVRTRTDWTFDRHDGSGPPTG